MASKYLDIVSPYLPAQQAGGSTFEYDISPYDRIQLDAGLLTEDDLRKKYDARAKAAAAATVPPKVEDEGASWLDINAGVGVDTMLVGPQRATRGMFNTLAAGAMALQPQPAIRAEMENQRRFVSDFFGQGLEAAEQLKPEAYRRDQEKPIVDRDKQGNLQVHTPTAAAVLGTIGSSLSEVPELLFGGGLFTGAVKKAAGYGASNAMVASANQFDETYDAQRAQGVSHEQAVEQARNSALGVGAVSALTGALGLGFADKFGGAAASRLGGALKGVLTDAPFEAVEEMGQYAATELATGRKPQLAQALNRGALGFAAGAAPGGITGFLSQVRTNEPTEDEVEPTGDPDFDAGQNAAATASEVLDKIKGVADFDLNRAEQPDMFTKGPSIGDMFSGEMKDAAEVETERVNKFTEPTEFTDRELQLRDEFIDKRESRVAAAKVDVKNRRSLLGKESIEKEVDRRLVEGFTDLYRPELEYNAQKPAKFRQKNLQDKADVYVADALPGTREAVQKERQNRVDTAQRIVQGRKEYEAALERRALRDSQPELPPEQMGLLPPTEAAGPQAELEFPQGKPQYTPRGENAPSPMSLFPQTRNAELDKKALGTIHRAQGAAKATATKQESSRLSNAYRAVVKEYQAAGKPLPPDTELAQIVADRAASAPSSTAKVSNPAQAQGPVKAADLLGEIDTAQQRATASRDEMANTFKLSFSGETRDAGEVVNTLANDKSDWGQAIREAAANKRVRLTQATAEQKKRGAAGYYDPERNEVVLIQDNIPVEMTPTEVAAHELTHAGYQQQLMQAGALDQVYNRIVNLASGGNKIAQRAVEDVKARLSRFEGTPEQLQEKTRRETLVMAVQYAARARGEQGALGRMGQVVKDIITKVKDWMRSKGWKVTDLSINDIERAALRAANEYATGKDMRSDDTMVDVAERMQDRSINKALNEVRAEDVDELTPAPKTQNTPEELRRVDGTERNTAAPVTKQIKEMFHTGLEATMRSRGLTSKQIQENIENASGYLNSELAEANAAMNEARALIKKYNVSDEAIAQAMGGNFDAIAKYPKPVQDFVRSIHDKIAANSANIAKLIVQGKTDKNGVVNMTPDEIKLFRTIMGNLGKYTTRAYKLFLTRSVSKAWTQNLQKAARKRAEGKHLSKSDKAFNTIIDNVVGYLENNELVLPENLDELPNSRLDAMYRHWFGKSPGNMTREKVVAALEGLPEKTKEQIRSKAEALVWELLGVTNKKGGLVDFYRGQTLDRTILESRHDIPEPIAQLWGKIDEPAFNLFHTWTRQAQLISKYQMLNQIKTLGLEQGWIMPAEEKTGPVTENLNGEAWGSLDGMATTPRVKEVLSYAVEANVSEGGLLESLQKDRFDQFVTKGAGRYIGKPVRELAGWAKFASIVLGPQAYYQSIIGAPMQLVANGNFIPNASWGKGIDAAKGLLMLTYKKDIPDATKRALRADIVDSGVMGDLKEQERNQMIEFVQKDILLGEEGTFLQKMGREFGRGYRGAKQLSGAMSDVFAAMDLWSKIANFEYEYKFLRDHYARMKVPKTQEEVMREAAQRTKQTNISFNRTPKIFKAMERYGASMFLPYISETFRSLAGNYALAYEDVKRGKAVGDKQMVAHGMKRGIGATSAMALHGAATKGIFALLSGLMGLTFDDDELKDMDPSQVEAVRRGLQPYERNRQWGPLGMLNDGRALLHENSRFDMYDPVNALLRAAVSSDEHAMEEFGRSAWDIINANAIVNRMSRVLLNETGDAIGLRVDGNFNPSSAKTKPEAYRATLQDLMEAGFSEESANQILFLTEPLLPKVWRNLNEDPNQSVRMLQGFGLPLKAFDPKVAVGEQGAKQYESVVANTHNTVSDDLSKPVTLSNERVESVVLDGFAEEYKAFNEMQAKITAAKAIKTPMYKIVGALKEGGVPADQISMVLSGRFRPRGFGDRFLETARIKQMNEAKTPDEKLNINKKFMGYKRLIDGLRRTYMEEVNNG